MEIFPMKPRIPPLAMIRAIPALVLALPLSADAETPLRIDAGFPGGNIIVSEISGNDVKLRPDIRDTKGSWFYWNFRINGAAGKTVTFQFTEGSPIGVRGPAVSTDDGSTWKWLGEPKDTKSFSYTFPAETEAARFAFAPPYTQKNLDAFLESIGPNPSLRKETLCQSRKGRNVERLHVGKLDGDPDYRVLITCRSHACEMMMSHSVEGLIRAALASDERGQWFRDHVEMVVIPFVDKDGVEEGDQGKNRLPRDHNRDYNANALYPETRALQASIPKWSAGKKLIALDLHCPHIRGVTNEKIYAVGSENPEMEKNILRFSEHLERGRKGPLPYLASDNIAFGKDWNTAANFKAGTNCSRWAATIPGIDLACTFELPYANTKGAEVNAGSARAFGEDLATAIKAYLEAAH